MKNLEIVSAFVKGKYLGILPLFGGGGPPLHGTFTLKQLPYKDPLLGRSILGPYKVSLGNYFCGGQSN